MEDGLRSAIPRDALRGTCGHHEEECTNCMAPKLGNTALIDERFAS